MQAERHTIGEHGFELEVKGEARAWTWVLTRREAVAARGIEADRITAWRTGAFAAEAMAALERIGRRSF